MAKKVEDVQDALDVDNTNFKAKITLTGNMEEMPEWSDDEGADEEETAPKATVVAQVYGVGEPDASNNGNYGMVYMSFRRKEGDAGVFADFMSEIRSDMEKFHIPVEQEE